MVKLRKQRKRKKYNHNVNRKRLRNKIFKDQSIGCKEVKEEWDHKKSMKTNLNEMGLSYDPNTTIKIPRTKTELKKAMAQSNEGWSEDKVEEPIILSKAHVAQTLEEDAKAPREKKFRLPNSQIEWLTYLLEKYGSDYKAMARDKKNYNQETWKQIRQKIKRFMGIPEQFNEFLKKSTFKFDVDNILSDEEIC